MGDDQYRLLPVTKGKVRCLPDKDETLDHCRFCVYSRYFLVNGTWVKSPALAYCMLHRATDEADLKKVDAVKCADRRGEGFRSIMNLIG